jgi:hypothetical protein
MVHQGSQELTPNLVLTLALTITITIAIAPALIVNITIFLWNQTLKIDGMLDNAHDFVPGVTVVVIRVSKVQS